MRGYFGIGVEGVSKPMNVGNLMRSAHAFEASFVFTVDADYKVREARSDTSKTPENLPFYAWDSIGEMVLPKGCQMVAVELLETAVDLPSFRHPSCAAYVLGPERGSVTPQMLARCDHVIKIPTQFCINVATAGAIVMYDRVRSLGRFADRPVGTRSQPEPLPEHQFGQPVYRSRDRQE